MSVAREMHQPDLLLLPDPSEKLIETLMFHS